MIKFFRNIRKTLVNEGKTANYLKYAIGEIVLVVIGILIALQINSWNGLRLQKIKEKEILAEIENNLQVNLLSLEEMINNQNEMIKNIDLIINHLELKKPYTDSFSNALKTVKYIENTTLVTTAFESLKSSGMDIVSSEKLKGLIIQLFNAEYPYLIEWSNGISKIHYEALSTPFFIKYFFVEPITGKVKIGEYENLLKDQQFVNMLSSRRMFKISLISLVRRTQKATKTLLYAIQKELKNSN